MMYSILTLNQVSTITASGGLEVIKSLDLDLEGEKQNLERSHKFEFLNASFL